MSEASTPVLEEEIALWERIEEIFRAGDKAGLLRVIRDERPADVAEALSGFEPEDVASLFRIFLIGQVAVAAEILIELEPGVIAGLYEALRRREWVFVLQQLSDDEVVEVIEYFPEEAREDLLARMTQKDQREIRRLMDYPEDSAGRIMTSEFVSMEESATVGEATELIREHRDFDPTNIFDVYVTRDGVLEGLVDLRQILINRDQTRLGEIMVRDILSVSAEMDQEEVAELFRRHDELTIPVVDEQEHILGIITIDDVIDVIDEESDEDIYKIIGTSDEEIVAAGRTRRIVALRLPWIMAALGGSLLVALVMKYTEQDVFGSMAGKIFVFVPIICAMGGNVGVQSATIMARTLSQGNPDWREARRSIYKEAKVGLALGLVCGVLVGAFATSWGGPHMLIVVLSAMVSAMTTAAITGTIIPVVMKRLGFDPALATGPFVTSFNDLLATVVYFAIAWLFLDRLVI